MDAIFYLTIIFIFVAAVTGIFINRRNRDRCLRDFARFNVSVYLKDGRRVWGELEVFSNGLEILYTRATPRCPGARRDELPDFRRPAGIDPVDLPLPRRAHPGREGSATAADRAHVAAYSLGPIIAAFPQLSEHLPRRLQPDDRPRGDPGEEDQPVRASEDRRQAPHPDRAGRRGHAGE